MGNISNSQIVRAVDHIAAIAKAQANVYTATLDFFDIMVKEQNPDDLLNGTDAAVAVDDNLSTGDSIYTQFSNMTSWLAQRAVSASSTSLPTLAVARKQRVPYSYDQYIYYPAGGSHFTQANIFYDDAITLGSFIYGGTFSGGVDLTLSGTYNWTVAEVQSASVAAWALSCSVVYADDSTGTEYFSLAGTETTGDTTNIGIHSVDEIALDASYVLPLSGTTGMAAGQVVLLYDNTYPIKLESNIATGGVNIAVGSDQLGWYDTGDAIWIQDDNSTETGTIEDINYRDGAVTLSAALSGGFATDDNGFIRKAVATGAGWQEMHTIASVSAANAIGFSATLEHSYYTSAKAVQLIKDVYGSATLSGGSADDEIAFKTKSERTISQR